MPQNGELKVYNRFRNLFTNADRLFIVKRAASRGDLRREREIELSDRAMLSAYFAAAILTAARGDYERPRSKIDMTASAPSDAFGQNAIYWRTL
ncbi:unnamed protein product [Oikopleura dioica]|uniref:Uncharacterized protein n=1 Tax=Oikopleura dioica TaxID=34765 RepID=E4YW36_OIKDI|nr:unnamed protein product [Oikopleura dioica]